MLLYYFYLYFYRFPEDSFGYRARAEILIGQENSFIFIEGLGDWDVCLRVTDEFSLFCVLRSCITIINDSRNEDYRYQDLKTFLFVYVSALSLFGRGNSGNSRRLGSNSRCALSHALSERGGARPFFHTSQSERPPISPARALSPSFFPSAPHHTSLNCTHRPSSALIRKTASKFSTVYRSIPNCTAQSRDPSTVCNTYKSK